MNLAPLTPVVVGAVLAAVGVLRSRARHQVVDGRLVYKFPPGARLPDVRYRTSLRRRAFLARRRWKHGLPEVRELPLAVRAVCGKRWRLLSEVSRDDRRWPRVRGQLLQTRVLHI